MSILKDTFEVRLPHQAKFVKQLELAFDKTFVLHANNQKLTSSIMLTIMGKLFGSASSILILKM